MNQVIRAILPKMLGIIAKQVPGLNIVSGQVEDLVRQIVQADGEDPDDMVFATDHQE